MTASPSAAKRKQKPESNVLVVNRRREALNQGRALKRWLTKSAAQREQVGADTRFGAYAESMAREGKSFRHAIKAVDFMLAALREGR